jgi:hypothetical protein
MLVFKIENYLFLLIYLCITIVTFKYCYCYASNILCISYNCYVLCTVCV